MTASPEDVLAMAEWLLGAVQGPNDEVTNETDSMLMDDRVSRLSDESLTLLFATGVTMMNVAQIEADRRRARGPVVDDGADRGGKPGRGAGGPRPGDGLRRRGWFRRGVSPDDRG